MRNVPRIRPGASKARPSAPTVRLKPSLARGALPLRSVMGVKHGQSSVVA